eukprot:6258533-Prorocentrum_lima.AAC.1
MSGRRTMCVGLLDVSPMKRQSKRHVLLNEASLGLPNYAALAACQFAAVQARVALADQKQLGLDAS